MQLDEVLALLEGVRGHTALCPAHDDRSASLSFAEGDDGRILLNCHRGCSFQDICDALGVPMSAMMGEQETAETVYTYLDEERRPLFDVVRKPGKDFLQRRYVGDSTEWGLGDTRRVLYRLPDLIEADPNRWVFVVEGEKDAEAFWERGYIATCNPGGAGKWMEEFSKTLEGRNVIVVQDDDETGRKHAAQVMVALRGKANTVKLVQARAGKDSSDHFAAGYEVADFVEPSYFAPYDFTKPSPPVNWIWENYVAQGDLILLAGREKLGKSWLTMGLSVAVANDHQWFLNQNVMTGRVLYFDEENPEDVAHSRMVGALGHKTPDNLRYVLHGGLRLDTHPELLMQEALLYGPRLMVIDSLSAVQAKEENSRSEMGSILREVLKPLAIETGSAIILIHHHDKQGYGYRGSGDIGAAVDSIINLHGTAGSGSFTMTTQSRRRRSSHEKLWIQLKDIPGVGTRIEGQAVE